jgi:hypothetical protein
VQGIQGSTRIESLGPGISIALRPVRAAGPFAPQLGHAMDRDGADTTMIDIYNQATNQRLGSITEADLQVLQDALEEESSEDQDYYIDTATIDVIADGRATEHLVNVLRAAVGTSPGVDIRWERR